MVCWRTLYFATIRYGVKEIYILGGILMSSFRKYLVATAFAAVVGFAFAVCPAFGQESTMKKVENTVTDTSKKVYHEGKKVSKTAYRKGAVVGGRVWTGTKWVARSAWHGATWVAVKTAHGTKWVYRKATGRPTHHKNL